MNFKELFTEKKTISVKEMLKSIDTVTGNFFEKDQYHELEDSEDPTIILNDDSDLREWDTYVETISYIAETGNFRLVLGDGRRSNPSCVIVWSRVKDGFSSKILDIPGKLKSYK